MSIYPPSARQKFGEVAPLILFVDDEPIILELRRHVFEGLGYSVLTADSGSKALQLLMENKVDAVVLDYQMPEMDGKETAIRIREAYGRTIPIISCSGSFWLPADMLEYVDAIIEKGASPQMLIDKVNEQLRVARCH